MSNIKENKKLIVTCLKYFNLQIYSEANFKILHITDMIFCHQHTYSFLMIQK